MDNLPRIALAISACQLVFSIVALVVAIITK